MTRVSPTGVSSTALNTPNMNFQGQSQAVQTPPIAEQVQQTLFGRVAPRQLNSADFPDLAALLRLLDKHRRKLVQMHGDADEDYRIVLADDTIAMIDKDGTIYMGAAFLSAFQNEVEVLVGVLAHEIGHRPKRWTEPQYQVHQELTREDMEAICREEETRADIFAGKGLAELGYSCEPVIEFIKRVQKRPHPEYFPAEVRAEVIRDAHAGRTYRSNQRRKLFPGYHRHVSVRGHLGDG
jgi:predicted Zn-dependent protease